jgi:general secretion pathway protein I
MIRHVIIRHRQPRQQGFTLLELMVALTIFAVAALTALKHSAQTIRQQEVLEQKTLALWLAENTLAELRLTTPWPATGTVTKAVTSANREWNITIQVSDTALGTFRKVVVSVRPPENDDRTLATLTGYVGQH